MQEQWDSVDRAERFYDRQVLDHLNPKMREFLSRQHMMFVSTADARGECDCSFRAGAAGFVTALDERTIVFPELRGNGVYASLGNLSENPHIGLLFIDFFTDLIGLHINGRAAVLTHADLVCDARVTSGLLEMLAWQGGRRPERWVLVEVDEAYVHCSKHIPRLAKLDRQVDWGTDDVKRKGGDYFEVAAERATGAVARSPFGA